MANVLQSPQHVNKDSFHVHPLEQLTKFSSTVGELLPVYYDLLYPGDKVTLNSILKTRLLDMKAATMCNIQEHIDWFAVPLNQLYMLFSNYYFGINDIHSSIFELYSGQGTPNLNNRLPRVPRQNFSADFKGMCTAPDKYFPAIKGTCMRLMELMGFPLHKYGWSPTPDEEEPTTAWYFPMDFFPMIPLAYQKIYFDYYRLSDREPNDPFAYNVDHAFSSGYCYSYGKYFTLRYRPWNKDFFTHLYTSPLMGTESVGSWNFNNGTIGGTSPLINQFQQWLNSSDASSYQTYDSAVDSDNENPAVVAYDGDYFNSPTQIRTAFAVDKLLEITRRAGKHVDQQLLAHFGVKVSPKVSGEVEYIGGSSSDIIIGDVIATAGSDVNALGQVGGKGYNSDKAKTIKWSNDYDCPVILMAIYSAVPAVDYAVTGLDRFHTYVDNSYFFRPVMDNLGMQPQFEYQRFLHLEGIEGTGIPLNALISGWQYRWMESKMKFNRVCGSLARTNSFWTTRRSLISESTALSEFLINPQFLNPAVTFGYDFGNSFDWQEDNVEPWEFTNDGLSTPSTLFDSDPLLHEFYVHCNKASKMSTYGLPSL